MRWIVSLLAAAVLFSSTHAHAVKIGFVDLKYAIRNVKDGKKARARLTRMRGKYQKMLNRERKRLDAARKLYIKRRPLLRGKAKQREERKLQKMLITTQQKYRRLMRQLQLSERREMALILRKMRVVLQTIIRDKGIQLMLEKGGSRLLHAPKRMDHTKELIRRYEKAFRGKRKKRKKKRR